MMKVLALICLFPLFCAAQINDYSGSYLNSSDIELTYKKEKDTIKKHSITLAVVLSAAVPGAGQIYNHIAMPKGKKKAYWKVPLIYAGLGATGYFLISNQRNVNSLRNEYDYMALNNGEHIPGSEWQSYDQSAVLQLYDQYQNWRDLSILGMTVVYILQLVDAGVEAHFVNFDVSKDLSMSFQPTIVQGNNPGLSLTLNFR